MTMSILHRYRELSHQAGYLIAIARASALFVASIGINFLAGTYATERESNPVTDIVLSNIRVFDVDFVFVYGVPVLILLIAGVIFLRPYRIPFTLESIAAFIVIRSLFISMTYIGPFPERATIDSILFGARLFLFGGDLFFSGHTGIPFLLALTYWRVVTLRYLFLGWSILFAVTALLGHYHYTIDVLSAFFITYTIYHICVWLFRSEYVLFLRGEKKNRPVDS